MEKLNMGNQKDNLLNHALSYLAKGWPVMPINPSSKKPCLMTWKHLQARLPTVEEIEEQWGMWSWANIGLVAGKLSGVSVVDVDPRHSGTIDGLPETVKAQTGGGGWHYFYKYNESCHSQNALGDGLDLKTDGSYVIIAPSVHASGNKYVWITPPFVNEYAEIPQWILDKQKTKSPPQSFDWNQVIGTKEGSRDINLYRAACSLLAKGISAKLVYLFLIFLGQSFKPPMGEVVVRKKFESAVKFLLRERQNNG